MNKTIENIKNGNYSVVDKQGVSVTEHFVNCLEQEFADLEAKLAESEKKHLLDEKEWQDYCAFKHIEPQIKGCLDRERELKQQLAEKEKKLNDWKDGTIICKWTDAENKVKYLEHQLAEKEELIMFADRTIKGLVLAKEIDKISFALEQLEKVKEKIREDREGLINYNNASEVLMADAFLCDCKNFIDNQIEELKKELE